MGCSEVVRPGKIINGRIHVWAGMHHAFCDQFAKMRNIKAKAEFKSASTATMVFVISQGEGILERG